LAEADEGMTGRFLATSLIRKFMTIVPLRCWSTGVNAISAHKRH
jgi:hypothetical protein